MNSQFYLTLKRITPDRYDNEDIVAFLEQDLFELQFKLQRIQAELKSELETVKNYCLNGLAEINHEENRIKQFHEVYERKFNTARTIKEKVEYELDLQYYREILNLIYDVRWEFLRFLIGHYPEEYTSELLIQEIQEQAPIGDPVIERFLEKYKPRFLRLREKLTEYGFFTLEKTKVLGEEKRNKILVELVKEKLPFWIALFDLVGYKDYLESFYQSGALSLGDIHRMIQAWYSPEADADGRNVRHHWNSPIKAETKEAAEEFYEKLLK